MNGSELLFNNAFNLLSLTGGSLTFVILESKSIFRNTLTIEKYVEGMTSTGGGLPQYSDSPESKIDLALFGLDFQGTGLLDLGLGLRFVNKPIFGHLKCFKVLCSHF